MDQHAAPTPDREISALREILAAMSQNRADEAPVFETILTHARQLCDAPFAGLWLLDAAGRAIDLVAAQGARAEYLATASRAWDLQGDASVPRAIRARAPVQVEDLKETEGYRRGDPQRVEAVEIEGIRSFLAIPLVGDGAAIGAIGLYRRDVRPFAPEQIRLLETFAAQAVIAIENVRQFREVQARLEREKASAEILETISQSRNDEAPVFKAILENASRLCEAPLAFMSVVTPDGAAFRVPAHLGAGADMARVWDDQLEMLDGSDLTTSQAIRDGQTIHVEDLANDPVFGMDNPRRAELVTLEGVRSYLVAPLVKDDLCFGTINLYRREVRPFAPEQIRLLETFAAQAVIAIENARQFRALADRTEEVQALNASLEARVETQVGEIERMGRLKRFLSPAVADAVISAGDEALLQSHRAMIATLFADMRGFTAFCETAEPEETIEVLQTFHEEMGVLIRAHAAGVDTRSGDGLMVIMGDPLPCDDPAGAALDLALAMRARMTELCRRWKRMGHRLGFGVGLSLGYATVGLVGSEGRYDYTANGATVNLAARLCDHARDGEILLSPRAYMALEDRVAADSLGDQSFKGIKAPVEVFRVAAGV